MKNTLKEALRPLYEPMLKDERISVLSEQDYCCMAPFVGNKFPKTPNDGIIFYGRANNGWKTGVNNNFDEIYDDGPTGVIEHFGSSPFFRTAGKAFSNFYGEDWYKHVTYSNIYKIAPSASNPGTRVCNYQWEYVANIFMKEIEILSPKIVVLFTNEDWGWKFLFHANGNNNPQLLLSKTWSNYSIDIYKIGNVYYLLTEHPQCKPEEVHADAIINIIQEVKEGKL